MERESLDVDILAVGAGVACLSTVIRLLKKFKQNPSAAKEPPKVLILEKGHEVGAHVLSGAIIDTAPLKDLLTSDEFSKLPVKSVVQDESFYFLTNKLHFRLPYVPPPMHSKGLPIVSLGEVTRYLGKLCEGLGAEIYCDFTAVSLLEKDGQIIGVRLGDKGVDKKGNQKPSFEPGMDIMAKAVVLGEGAHGLLTEKLLGDKGMNTSSNPQAYAIGIKEMIELPMTRPNLAGTIIHTFGHPHDYFTYGGGFLYAMTNNLIAIGLVTALDYRKAELRPHELFRAYKRHPLINSFIVGGHAIQYGAKVLPEGGLFSVPQMSIGGAIVVGDSAGLLDALRLKGIHLAIESGIAAGDTLYDCYLANDFTATALAPYQQRMTTKSGWKQMERTKNVRTLFDYGRLPGLMAAGMSSFTGGLLPPGRWTRRPDYQGMRPLHTSTCCCCGTTCAPKEPEKKYSDDKLQMNIETDLYYSGTKHEEDQPCHLVIVDPELCRTKCFSLYGAPCTRFCPAEVYKLPEGEQKIHIEPANCLHCKTCQIKDPLCNIRWQAPEGGGGPNYKDM